MPELGIQVRSSPAASHGSVITATSASSRRSIPSHLDRITAHSVPNQDLLVLTAFSAETLSACFLRDGFVVGDYVAIINCRIRLRFFHLRSKTISVPEFYCFLRFFKFLDVSWCVYPFRLIVSRSMFSSRFSATAVQDPAFRSTPSEIELPERDRMPTPTIRHSVHSRSRRRVGLFLLPSWATPKMA